MTIVFGENERFSNMEKIANLKMEGRTDTAIGKELGIPRKEVIELYSDYKSILQNDNEARDLAKDHLYQLVSHFDSLIKRYYDLINEIDSLDFSHQVAGQKNAALKAIAELEAKRLDALQKAGLLDSAELGDELAEMEEKQEKILDILKHDLCKSCQATVARKLSEITKKAEVIEVQVIDDDE